MTRYQVQLAYYGTPFVGWQKQPNEVSVQSTIEKNLSTLLQVPTEVVGCGRTDSGVHASQYCLHFDGPDELPQHFLGRFNKLVGKHIAIQRVQVTTADFHARFAAQQRAYTYFLMGTKPIFHQTTRSYYPQFSELDFSEMEKAAALLLQYGQFTPFCKTNSDAHTMNCQLFESRWEKREDDLWVYHIRANRFLRGMVRLIVGMCLNVGMGKMEIADVQRAMENQAPLKRSLSAPAAGLYLSEVIY